MKDALSDNGITLSPGIYYLLEDQEEEEEEEEVQDYPTYSVFWYFTLDDPNHVKCIAYLKIN